MTKTLTCQKKFGDFLIVLWPSQNIYFTVHIEFEVEFFGLGTFLTVLS
jgi:hypothetical protein